MRLYAHFTQEKYWGLLTAIDLYDCEAALIRNEDMIKVFVTTLCEKIEVKRFGPCQVVHFGEDEKVCGYSMVQLIETSIISAHFVNKTNAACIDVFSCKYYDPEIVAQFAQEFFEARSMNKHIILRSKTV